MASGTSLTLEDIQHLSDEVRLLVRAGLPLEQHLAAAGRGHSSRLQEVTQAIADGLGQGHSLQQVVEQSGVGASRMLASAVAAGVRTGDLATTIEMMGDFAGDLELLRRQIFAAMIYPATILTLAYALFALVVRHGLIQIRAMILDFQISVHPVLEQLMQWNETHPEWLWFPPAAALIVVTVWLGSGRAAAMEFRGPERLLLLLPGISGVIRDMRFYTLTRMLSLLIEKQVPLPDALLVAGSTCGSDDLDRACRQTAEQVRNGTASGILPGSRWRRGQLPPLLRACLQQTATDGDRFHIRLKAITEHYRTRLEFNTAWLTAVLPCLLLVIIGGGTVLLYASSVFWPVIEIYRSASADRAPL